MIKRLNIKYLAVSLITLITFLVYLPALQNDFVNWDDDDYVYENPYIQKINISFFRWAFFDFHAANWHPLTWISHAIDYAMWGLNPLGHHLTNNILHSMNTLLVILLVIKLAEVFEESRRQGGTPSAFLHERTKVIIGAVTGLLFGIHPLHVESVAWISERKDLLCALFFLLSILSYTKYARADDEAGKRKLGPRFLHKQYLFSFGFFVLALLSKPMAVTLPAVLLIIDWYPYRRTHSVRTFMENFKEKLPFFFLSLLSSVVTILAQSSGKALVPLEYSTVASRLVIGAKALILYLYKVISPVHLIPFYPYPEHVSLLSFYYSFFVLLVIGIAAASIAAARKQKIWLAIWLYYVITLLPVLGIIRVGAQSMADRYAYLPTLGHFILAGLGVAVLFEKVFDLLKRKILAKALVSVMSGLAVILLSYATISQIGIWKSSIVFMELYH